MDALTMILDPAVVIGLGVGCVFLMLGLGLSAIRHDRTMDIRLKHTCNRAMGKPLSHGLDNPASPQPNQPARPTDVRKEDRERTSPVERAIAARIPKRSALQRRLARTGKSISLLSYTVGSLLLGGLIGLFTTLLMGWPPLISALLAVAGAVWLPLKLVEALGNRRSAHFNAAFPDAIDLMVRGLKSGLPVTESIASVGREMKGPVGEEFQTVADGIRLGQQMDDLLWECAQRLQIQEFKFFVICLSIQRETGGNLAETLGNLSEVLRGRKQMGLKIIALSSEARASAYILGSLPFLMGVILYLLNGDYISTLFIDPRGQMAVGFGLIMIALGALIMWRMAKFEV